jgi:hypothetical protein
MWSNTSGNSVIDPYYIDPALYTFANRDVLSRTPKSSADVVGANAITIIQIGDSLSTNSLTAEVAPPVYSIVNPTKLFNFNFWDGSLYVSSEPLLGAGPKLIAGGFTGVANWLTECADALITANTARKITIGSISAAGLYSSDWKVGGNYNRSIQVVGRRLDSMGLLTGTAVIAHVLIGVNDCGVDELEGASTRTPLYAANLDSIVSTIRTYMPGAKIVISKNTWGGGPLNPAAGHQLLGFATVRSAIDAKVNGTTIFAGADLDTLGDSYRQPTPDFTHWNFATGLSAVAGLVKDKIALAL